MMPRLHKAICACYVSSLLALAAAPASQAAEWVGRLQDGSLITVDPDTHRATRFSDHGSVQMWDGVHRLEDGQSVIIRDGVAVPSEQMINAWQAPPPPPRASSEDPCVQLVQKVCGPRNECAVENACPVAKQLLRRQGEERRRLPYTPGVLPTTAASLQCKQALAGDDFFIACPQALPATQDTLCHQLAEKVCGSAGKCADVEACSVANQLVQMEAEERAQDPRPGTLTYSSSQCQEALTNEGFFSPCPPSRSPDSR